MDPSSRIEHRTQDFFRNKLRDRVGNSNIQFEAAFGRHTFDSADEFLAQGKNLVGITKNQFSSLGQGEISTGATKERFTRGLLKSMDLSGNRRLRNTEFFRSSSQAS